MCISEHEQQVCILLSHPRIEVAKGRGMWHMICHHSRPEQASQCCTLPTLLHVHTPTTCIWRAEHSFCSDMYHLPVGMSASMDS